MHFSTVFALFALASAGCTFRDPPTPPSASERLDAKMQTCSDLERDTIFVIAERYASGHIDTSVVWKQNTDSTRAPRFAADSWYLRVKQTVQLNPMSSMDSAELRYRMRRDSLQKICTIQQHDTIWQNPINHPLPTQALYKILAHMIDTAHGDTLRTSLPAGYGFSLFGAEQGIRLVHNSHRITPNDEQPWVDSTEYPKQIHSSYDSLIVPLIPQERWGLLLRDAYGFEDSLILGSTTQ